MTRSRLCQCQCCVHQSVCSWRCDGAAVVASVQQCWDNTRITHTAAHITPVCQGHHCCHMLSSLSVSTKAFNTMWNIRKSTILPLAIAQTNSWTIVNQWQKLWIELHNRWRSRLQIAGTWILYDCLLIGVAGSDDCTTPCSSLMSACQLASCHGKLLTRPPV